MNPFDFDERKNGFSVVFNMSNEKLKVKNYFGYAACDMANNMAFCVMSSYLSVYCSDILGISGFAITAIMIAARIWDGINDPIMGFLAQMKKPGKNGKYRPFLICGGYPLAVSAVLVYLKFTDNLAFNTFWIAFTYILYGMLYTVVLVPYGSLASVMTTKDNERSILSMARSVGGGAGALPTIIFPILVMTAGDNGNQMDAFRLRIAMCIIAVFMIIMYSIGYKLTNESVIISENEEKVSIISTLKSVITNRAFVTMSIIGCLLIAAQMYTSTVNLYLFKDYFKNSAMNTIYTIVTYIPMAVFVPFANLLIKKIGKKEVCVIGFSISLISSFLTYILHIGEDNIMLFVILAVFTNFGVGFATLEVWSMAADIIDCNEWKSGKREEASNYALFTFMRKIGQAIAAFAPWFVSLAGYNSKLAGVAEQGTEVLDGMYNVATIVPCIMYGIMLIMAIIYPLNKATTAKMHSELEESRKAYKTETV